MIISSYLQLSCPCCSPVSSLSPTWDCFNQGGLTLCHGGPIAPSFPAQFSLALATSSPCRTAMINWKALGLKYESFRWLVRVIISSQLHMTVWPTLGSHWNSFIFNATGISLSLCNRVRPIIRCGFCLGWACLDILKTATIVDETLIFQKHSLFCKIKVGSHVIEWPFPIDVSLFVRYKLIDRSNSVSWISERQEYNCAEIVLISHYFQNERLLHVQNDDSF